MTMTEMGIEALVYFPLNHLTQDLHLSTRRGKTIKRYNYEARMNNETFRRITRSSRKYDLQQSNSLAPTRMPNVFACDNLTLKAT
jgi:hypothetical protein